MDALQGNVATTARRVLVIAEPGAIHEGDFTVMQDMVHVAAKSGADVMKFQWVSDPKRLAERRHAPEYAEAYQRIAFSRHCLPMLAADCFKEGIEFACTVYLPEDVPVIAPLVKVFKVASFEAENDELIRAMRPYSKPIMVSCGMGQNAVGVLRLHCISAYPAPLHDLNLAVLRDGFFSGFSDHSGQTITGALAVAAGARIVEAHYRLDDCDPKNPDFPHSLTPAEFAEYVRLIRLAEQAMGDGVHRCMPSEQPMERYRVRG